MISYQKTVHRMKLLTSLATLLAVVGVANCALTMEEIMATGKILRSHCQKKVGVSSELVDAASSGQFADDRNLKCFFGCMMGLSHSLKNAKYQADVVLQIADDLLPPELGEKVKYVVQNCRDAGEGIDDHCEVAMAIVKCAYDLDSENFFLP